MNRFLSITLIAVFCFARLVSDAYGQVATTAEEALIGFINEARKAPLATAEALGKNREQVLSDFPDIAAYLKNGFDLLKLNSMLTSSAADHNRDMIANNYYAEVSLDGKTAGVRISEAGYSAAVSGESLGKLTFSNFISPVAAARLIFERMYLDELNPGYTGQRNILRPEFDDVGIDIDSGNYSTGTAKYNFYMATCDFGLKDNSEKRMAQQLVQLINQARSRPLDVATALGINAGSILADFPELASYLFTGMPPLAVNDDLNEVATAHTMDMIDGGYFSVTSPGGVTIRERVAGTGYEIYLSGEVIFQVESEEPLKPDAAIATLFKMIYMAEIDPEKKDSRIIMNRDFEDIGVWVSQIVDIRDGKRIFKCIGTVVAATHVEWVTPRITGLVYRDMNGDGLYTPGEELQGEELALYGEGELKTDEAGFFQLPISPGVYQISLFRKDKESIDKEIDLDFDNKGIYFLLDEADDKMAVSLEVSTTISTQSIERR